MKTFSLALFILMSAIVFAQGDNVPKLASPAQGCDQIFVDIEKGTLNGVKPSVSQEEVKKALPCSTGETSEADEWMNCGGGVFFLNHDFYFYTGKDFIEVRRNFKGKLSISVFTMSEDDLRKRYGKPARLEEEINNRYLFFKMKYGTLVVDIDKEGVRKFDMYNAAPESIKLCL